MVEPMTTQLTEREEIARIIDPAKWRVLDNYLAETKRKYTNGEYDPAAFQDKDSLAKADAILSRRTPSEPREGEERAPLAPMPTAPWVLTAEQAEAFVAAVARSPEPNEALTAAAARYRDALEKQLGGGLYPIPILSDADDQASIRAMIAAAPSPPSLDAGGSDGGSGPKPVAQAGWQDGSPNRLDLDAPTDTPD